jgi:3'-phosphoadenosine 5'-phosphosulfate sulfotransferase (PAPS reductase)/FAD synthetase
VNLELFLEIGRLRSKQPQYQSKKQKAQKLIIDMLASHNAPYLALSGGKDSVAMAYIVDEAATSCGKDFRVWSHISDASFPGTAEIVRTVCDRLGRPLDIFQSSGAFDAAAGKEKGAFGKSGVFYDSVREYAKDKDLSFVGVRAYESKRRMKAARIKGAFFYSESMGGVTVCHPLLWFRLEDVAAAIYEHDAPMHPIYSKRAVEGRNKFGEEQWVRLGYVTSKDLLNKGTAVFLKLNYPELYAKFAKAYPELRLYV